MNKNISLYFLGKRNYVNGLTLFEEMLNTFLICTGGDLFRLTGIIRFEIFRFLRYNCSFEFYEIIDHKKFKYRNPVSRMDILYSNIPYRLLFYENRNSPVDSRKEDYPRDIYLESETAEKNGFLDVNLTNIFDLYSLVRGIVESNFRYCRKIAQYDGIDEGVSWAYLNGFRFLEETDFSRVDKVSFFRKSVVHSPQKVFIVREIMIEKLGIQTGCDICFFYNKGSKTSKPAAI